MTLRVTCLLKHVFLDPPKTASTPKKPANRGPKPKQIGTSDYCRTCGFFEYLNSTGQLSHSSKATENLFLREFVKADDLRDLDFTLSQTEDQSSRVCSHCSNQVRGTRAGFSSIKASFQESEHDDDRFRFLKYRNVRITSSLCFSRCFNLIIDNTS